MSTEKDQWVESELPCKCGAEIMGDWCPVSCPKHYRPVISAKLREMEGEIDRLRVGESEELWNACAKLRDRLDIDENPGMMGSATEVVLVAIDEIELLRTALGKANADLMGCRQLKADLRAEAERVTERDCAAICRGCNDRMPFHPKKKTFHFNGMWLECQALHIRAAQAKEPE